MYTYEDIKDLIPYEFLCNVCSTVEYKHSRVSFSYEYGISWADFIDQYQSECVDAIKEYLETVTDEKIEEWLTQIVTNNQDTMNYLLEINLKITELIKRG